MKINNYYFLGDKFFECMGITDESVEDKKEKDVIKALVKNARKYYQKYKKRIHFNRDYKFQIRKITPGDFGRKKSMAWYYISSKSSEGVPFDNCFLDKGSYSF